MFRRRVEPVRREVTHVVWGPEPFGALTAASLGLMTGMTMTGHSGAIRIGYGGRRFHGRGPALQQFTGAAQMGAALSRTRRPRTAFPSTVAPGASTNPHEATYAYLGLGPEL